MRSIPRRTVFLLAACATIWTMFYLSGFLADYCGRDLFAFWAAGRKIVLGRNPFGMDFFDILGREAGCPKAFSLSVANPPWSNALFGLLGLMSFSHASILWPALNMFFLFGSLEMIFRLVLKDGDLHPERRWLIVAIIFSFEPIYFSMYLGQLSLFILFFYCVFVYAVSTGRAFMGGGALAITLMKPQLVYTTYLLVIFSAALPLKNDNARRVFAGFASTFMCMNIAGYFLSPESYENYFDFISPLIWYTPTLASWVRWWAPGFEWIVPLSMIGAAGYLVVQRKRASDRLELYGWALVLGICTTPYLWTCDFVMLIPVLIILAVRYTNPRRRTLLWLLLIANAALALGPSDMRYGVWYPLYVLALWALHTDRGKSEQAGSLSA